MLELCFSTPEDIRKIKTSPLLYMFQCHDVVEDSGHREKSRRPRGNGGVQGCTQKGETLLKTNVHIEVFVSTR